MKKNNEPIVVAHLRHEIKISCAENGARCIEIKNEEGKVITYFEAHLSHDTALGYGCGYVDGSVNFIRERRLEERLCKE